mgnify:CR=1 FL=1
MTLYIFLALAIVSVITALLMVLSRNPVHSVLFLILTFFAIAGQYVLLNAQFLAVVHIIVYAGAIMVLFVFVVMMLNLGPAASVQERQWMTPGIWGGPAMMSLALLCELLYVLFGNHSGAAIGLTTVDAKAVGISLFGPYLLVVELASMLLLAALVAAFHLGRHEANE